MFRIAVACLVLFVSTSLLANDDPEFDERVRASQVVSEDESILISSNVHFYPRKRGHGPLSGGKKKVKARIVFTDKAYSVVSWSKRKNLYEVVYSEQYSELSSSRVSGSSPFLRLVTENKEGRFNSFELTDSKNALAPNTVKTREAHELILAAIAGKDVVAVAESDGLTTEDLSNLKVAEQQKRLQMLEERIARLEGGEPPVEEENKAECDCVCPPAN